MIEHQVRLAGVNCAVCEFNPSAAITVIALHGWLDNLASFEPLIPYLSHLRVLAFDFPGHGHSEHIGEGSSYHFVDGIYLIDDLAAHFGLEHLNLLGHSMGGSVASLYAAAQPARVNKLAMIEALGPLTSKAEEAPVLLRKAIEQRRTLREKRKPVYASFEEALAARSEASAIAPELIMPIVERALVAVEHGLTWRADARLRIASAMRLSEELLLSLLEKIEASTLIIEADAGLFGSSRLMQARKAHISRLQLEQLPGGHHLHMENPQKIGEIIDKFFTDL